VTQHEAKEILLLYRPGMAEEADPELTQALELARNDAALSPWFTEHCAFQEAMAAKFQDIPVPEGLKEQIISERKVRLASGFQRKAAVIAAAVALCCLCIGLASFYFRPHEDYSWSNFRNRMAGTVLRQYPKMDLETSDLAQVRQFLRQKQAHGDYVLPKGLEKTSPTGCAILSWKGSTVSMLCFNSGKKGASKDPDLFLFIVDRSAVKRPPGSNAPELSQVSTLATASWSSNGSTYLLAADGGSDFIEQYLPGSAN
jgi:hypothetical protein